MVSVERLVKTLLELYLAFEALTDHPYEFSSIVDGFFPLLTSCDGCNKVATDNMSVEKFLAQRKKQVIDMDLAACWLTLSMLSPMTFSKRLQFVYTTPMTFSRHNRKSNIFVLAARGGVENAERLDNLDYGVLLKCLEESGKGLQDYLNSMKMDELKNLYNSCFVMSDKRVKKNM